MTRGDVEKLIRDVAELTRRVEILDRHKRLNIGDHPDDSRWDCSHCGQVLAVFNTRTKMIRVQNREFSLCFEPLGHTQVGCKRCGHTNLWSVENGAPLDD